MRIIQLSDIHLSNVNLENLRNHYMSSLTNDLKEFHKTKPIDIILITGDLVDKGGSCLGPEPYLIFEEEFINPIIKSLNLKNSQILFIPGNHDIRADTIDEENEFFLSSKLTKELANEKLKAQEKTFTSTNRRIEKFKSFEKEFHKNTDKYSYSSNESLSIESSQEGVIGFALMNDSWRCSPSLKQEQHYIGFNQLFNANKYFEENNTEINIAVFHHPIEMLNQIEGEEIDNILKSKKFDLAFFGHSHRYKYDSTVSENGGLVKINGRSAFNSTEEKQANFQPGYIILDLDVKARKYTIHARKYIMSGYRFDKDVDSLKDGEISGLLNKQSYFKLNQDAHLHPIDLPSGYSADVNRIVKLLIGKSLYPNQYIFVRELIQNSVDACTRVKERHSNQDPKITVHINSEENYFEIIDEGDGMSKRVLREHFSIVGKSISQEFHDSLHNVNLISQFGIGFMSTFIVAQKVVIKTKSETDELIDFEIDDVFRGFNYSTTPTWEKLGQHDTGTLIRVYLKRDFNALNLLNFARQYCRHIKNLEFYLNNSLQVDNDSWNVEGGFFLHEYNNSKYEYKLTIGLNPRHLISTNSGFLINHNSPQIVPYKFPFIIGGEVVFQPRAIDFDLSRTNIIETEKSLEFKKEVSISLRILFRKAIESDESQLIQFVLNYLQYYLIHYELDQVKITESYSDFYSKKELIKLCSELLIFDFEDSKKSLSDILILLNSRNNRNIYYHTSMDPNDINTIVSSHLYGNGNLVIKPTTTNVQFRDSVTTISILLCLQVICKENRFNFIDIQCISIAEMEKIKISRDILPQKISNCLLQIEHSNQINIEIASIGLGYKAIIRFATEYVINYDNRSFQNILANIEDFDQQTLNFYFLGLLGLELNLSSISANNTP